MFRTKLVARVALAVGVLLVQGVPSAAQTDSRARLALEEFRKGFRPEKGHMRPLGDAGWKTRFGAVRQLVLLGSAAQPVLRESLGATELHVRLLAAQVLSITDAAGAEVELVRALENDASAPVRLYAADALGRLAGDDNSDISTLLRRAQREDKNGDVRAHAEFALEKSERVSTTDLRAALESVDLDPMDRAVLGEPAPALALEDASGRTVRLADFRGRKSVLLVFIYGDT